MVPYTFFFCVCVCVCCPKANKLMENTNFHVAFVSIPNQILIDTEL